MSGGRSWPYWTFIALLVLSYFTLHLGLGLEGEVPDLLTVAVLLGARRLGGVGAATLGLVLGLLRDSLSLVAFGADAVALAIVGYLASRSRDVFIGDSLLFVLVYLFVGQWIHELIYYLLSGSIVRGDAVTNLLVRAPMTALYGAAVGFVVLLIYRVVTGDR